MKYVAVIDIGKTNAKLAIVDCEQQREIDVVTTPNTTRDAPPYPHFDPDRIWQFIITGLKQFALLYDINAISVTTHGACVALLDGAGRLATPILDYEHQAPAELTADYSKIRPPFNETGSPQLAAGLNVGAQLYWLFRRFPDLHAKVQTVLMYPQYWAYRLSGVAANEPTSLGCHTDLWNPLEAEFSGLVDTLNIRGSMAPVTMPSTILGSIVPEVASATGLPGDTPVCCGIHDSNASLNTHLNKLEEPFSVVSTGTWVVCLCPGSDMRSLDESRDTLLNVNAAGRPTPSSRFMGGREYDYLLHTYGAEATTEICPDVLNDSIFILPAVETSTGPFQSRKYHWTHNPHSLSPAQRYNVISFYLAMMTETCLDLCNAQGPVIVEGPFAGNTLYCAMLGAATGREVLLPDSASSTGTGVGAALLVSQSSSGRANDDYHQPPAPESIADFAAYSREWKHLAAKEGGSRGS
jgi:sugar (pentulose or hexulose) kinase